MIIFIVRMTPEKEVKPTLFFSILNQQKSTQVVL